jgi:hypothetical protein
MSQLDITCSVGNIGKALSKRNILNILFVVHIHSQIKSCFFYHENKYPDLSSIHGHNIILIVSLLRTKID